ncbi:MAG: glycosyltransferase family 4 protein [Anaerolineales bacterium]|jgi:glycosyltransferase involved in cell wall biosynthesis|nr:glycosyltransferase family 4 protein [Anaerolineales bacterium]
MAEPLRILIAGVAWPMETFLQRLAKGLIDQGMLVTIANAHRPEAAWFGLPGFAWLQVSSSRNPVWRRLGFVLSRLLWALLFERQDYRKIRPELPPVRNFSTWFYTVEQILPYLGRRWDVIYFPWNSAAIEHRALFKLGMPVVVSCRGSQILVAPHNPRRKILRQGLEEIFTRASVVHCICKAIRDAALQFKLDPAKVKIIYPAVDPEYFNNINQNESDLDTTAFRIISVGSLVWVKGYEYALQAVAQLKRKGIHIKYEIIGSGQERNRILYTIRDLDLDDCVVLTGNLDPEQVLLHLLHADVFLHAAISEGFSNAVLEAQAVQLPVVCFEVGGLPENVENGKTGFVVPLRDHAAMAQALFRLWQDPDLRQRMGQAGRQKVLEQNSLKDQTSSFITLFHEAVERG